MRLVDVRLSRRDLPHSGDRLKSCLVSKKPSPVLGTYWLFASINLNHVIYLIGSIYHGPPLPQFLHVVLCLETVFIIQHSSGAAMQ